MNEAIKPSLSSAEQEAIISVAREFLAEGELVVKPYGHGIINDTYLVRIMPSPGVSEGSFVLQRLHPIFQPSVLEDMAIVTEHLAKKNILTPRLLRSHAGAWGVMRGERCWRLMTHIPGLSYDKGLSGTQIADGAELLGRFHNALQDLEYTFAHIIPGFHDTPRIMAKLRETVERSQKSPHAKALMPLAERTLRDWASVVEKLPPLPRRVIHGDLKISNVRFAEDGQHAVALLDLDTMGRNMILIDIGEAIQSWCNPADEDDYQGARLDAELFGDFIRGYTRTAAFLTREERHSIPLGVEVVILELAARFITDAFEEKYFKLDRARYPNLYEQNLTKARAKLVLLDDVRRTRAILSRAVDS